MERLRLEEEIDPIEGAFHGLCAPERTFDVVTALCADDDDHIETSLIDAHRCVLDSFSIPAPAYVPETVEVGRRGC